MPTITKTTTTTTEIEIDDEDIVDQILSEDNLTAETVKKIKARFEKIVLPWEPNGFVPPKYERRTASGVRIGLVDSWLGGYAEPHSPYKFGWGYEGKSPLGQGHCTSGIQPVDLSGLNPGSSDYLAAVKACEATARIEAQRKVDAFLRRHFPDLIFLD